MPRKVLTENGVEIISDERYNAEKNLGEWDDMGPVSDVNVKSEKIKSLRAEAKAIAEGRGTDEATRPMTYEEQRAEYYKERNPVTGAISSLSEYLAPEAFKSAIKGEPTVDWMEKAAEESAPAIATAASTLVPGAIAVRAPTLASRLTPAIASKYPTIAKMVAGAGEGVFGSGVYQGTEAAISDKDFSTGELATAAGIGAVLPIGGKITNKMFEKAFNASPEYFNKLSIANAKNIKNSIQTKIDENIAKWAGKEITPQMMKKATDEAIKSTTEIPPPMRLKLIKSLDDRYYGDIADEIKQLDAFSETANMTEDILRTPKEIQARLAASKASGLYDDPLRYSMGSPEQAGAFYRQELERLASAGGAGEHAKLVALKKRVTEPALFGRSGGASQLLDYLSPTAIRSIEAAKFGTPFIARPINTNVSIPLSDYLFTSEGEK